MIRVTTEFRQVESSLKWNNLCESLDCIMATAREPSFFRYVSNDKAMPAIPAKRRLPARTFGKEEQVLLTTFEKTDDVRLVALYAIILGVFLDVRLFLSPVLHVSHISNGKRRQRAMEEELETTLRFEICDSELFLKPFEFPRPVLGGFAGHVRFLR